MTREEIERISDEAGERITPEMLGAVPLSHKQQLRVEALRRRHALSERVGPLDPKRLHNAETFADEIMAIVRPYCNTQALARDALIEQAYVRDMRILRNVV